MMQLLSWEMQLRWFRLKLNHESDHTTSGVLSKSVFSAALLLLPFS